MPAPAPDPERAVGSSASLNTLTDRLYDFALTVTWDPRAGADAVRAAVEELGADLTADPGATYAVVRRLALQRARPIAAVPDDAEPGGAAAGPAMVEALALRVADSIDPSDRAVLDLAMRKALGGTDLATALEVSPHEVATVVNEARARVDRLLRNYVLARVGTDTCSRLEEALADPPDELGQLADIVDEHCATCSICEDRRRALAPPSNLLMGIPERPAADELRRFVVERSVDEGVPPGPSRRSRWKRFSVLALLVVAAIVAVAVGVRLLADRDEPDADEAPVGVLDAGSQVVDFGDDATVRTVALRNRGGASVAFEVKADVEWLTVDPVDGTLEAGARRELTLTFDRGTAPEGRSVTTARVVGEQEILELEITGRVSRPPVISKVEVLPAEISAAPCPDTTAALITASVVEESGLDSLLVSWTGPTGNGEARNAEMSRNDDRYEVTIGPFRAPGAVEWSVAATDSAGNVSRTAPARLAVVPCAEPPQDPAP